MQSELLPRLHCPQSGQPLVLDPNTAPTSAGDEVKDGWSLSEDGRHRYPIRGTIPRLVPESNYADNFGMQWNHFAKTQLDSHDVYALPFARGNFPYVYSLGVLQHTPDVARAFAALPPMLEKGGRLCADFYWNRLRTLYTQSIYCALSPRE